MLQWLVDGRGLVIWDIECELQESRQGHNYPGMVHRQGMGLQIAHYSAIASIFKNIASWAALRTRNADHSDYGCQRLGWAGLTSERVTQRVEAAHIQQQLWSSIRFLRQQACRHSSGLKVQKVQIL